MRTRTSPAAATTPRDAAGPALRCRRALLSTLAALGLVLGALIGLPGGSQAAGSLPCDIYGAAGTPCVAAHSTVRALLSSYDGPLYQVTRASDGATADIGPLSARRLHA